MLVTLIFDCVTFGVYIYKIMKFRDLLSTKEQIAPSEKEPKDHKKSKKSLKSKKSRKVEESKGDIEAQVAINDHPVVQEESVNLSVSSSESVSNLMNNNDRGIQQVAPVNFVQAAAQSMQQVHPQLVRIGDKTYIAVKASDFHNFNQYPQGLVRLERGHNSYMF